jgi:hypothetical protein
MQGASGETTSEAPPSQNSSEQLGPIGDLRDQGLICLEDLRLAADFIAVLRLASLDNPISGLSTEALHRLRSPSHDQPAQLIDEDSRMAIDLYLGN